MRTSDSARKIAEREGLCSLSSNTKWQQALPKLCALRCKKRIKYIGCEQPTTWQTAWWQPSLNYIEGASGPEKLKFIEWIEIERCELIVRGRLVEPLYQDHSNEIAGALESSNLTFIETETSFVALGYS